MIVTNSPESSLFYTLRPADRDRRIDAVLAAALPLSRSRLQSLLRIGAVLADGLPPQPDAKLPPGTVIEVRLPPPEPTELTPEPMALDILFEDEHLLALNKPPGIVVHPSVGHPSGTLVHALLHHCGTSLTGIGGVARPGIVHRLDKDTSGLLLVAKTNPALDGLVAQFKNRVVRKWYLAYLIGCPRLPTGTWNGPIGRDPRHRQKMAVIPSGKSAETRFRLLHASPLASRVEVEILTGRTHQIRVHAAHAGHPVVGDTTYGRPHPHLRHAPIPRQLLHAHRLTLRHPVLQHPIHLEAPEPADFQQFALWLSSVPPLPPLPRHRAQR
ncbi:MAG: RluA family pseudouridine synthase [Verrucomicrobiia bacterium]